MSAEASAQGDAFTIGAVRPLFKRPPQSPGRFSYDVMRNGTRALVAAVDEDRTAPMRWGGASSG